SWLVLTQLTQVFGVRGLRGDLMLHPQLVKEEFNKKGIASVCCQFAGKHLTVEYHNPKKLDAGQYAINEISINGKSACFERLAKDKICIARASINKDACIKVVLD